MVSKLGYFQLLILSLIGVIVWNFIPIPSGLSEQGWHLLIIFLLTIAGIVIEPMPIGVITLTSICISIVTKTLSFENAFSGFSSNIMWIVVFAFFIARGLIKTGLGKRIAYFFIAKIGRTTLGLSYGIIFTEFLLSLVIPSVSARAGGIMYPIVRSIVSGYDTSHSKESAHKNAMFLLQICFQGSVITCAMFVTAMSGNPLIISIAGKLGAEITWTNWAVGSIVPGVLNLLLLPILVYFLCPPSIKVSNSAPILAMQSLSDMGPLNKKEIIMSLTFIGLIIFWIFGKSFSIDSTTTALIGVVVLLISGILTWNDILSENSAWDIMIWFSIILTISGYLSNLGVMPWIGEGLEGFLCKVGYSKQALFLSIIFIYFFIHYFFASVTAHITVLYAIFVCLLTKLCNMSTLPACLIIAYLSSLSAGLTHYGNSAAPIFFGSKAFSIVQWWKIGFIICLFNLFIWIVSGYFWWKYLEII
jgi:DASS family divalent anion:Na+ symporter